MKVRCSTRLCVARLFAAAVCMGFVLLSVAARGQDAPPQGPDGMMRRGQGVRGTVDAIFPTYIVIKTDEGDSYKVSTGANTRVFKDRQPAKVTDIHTGDMLMIGGEVDATAKTVGAAFIAVVDAERVRKMREELGKSWVAGKITAIDETKITIQRIDGVTQTIAVDENTSFRKRRDSITLAEVKVGDNMSARGAVKDGTFVATEFGVGGGQGMMGFGPGGGRRGGGSGGTDPGEPNPPASPK